MTDYIEGVLTDVCIRDGNLDFPAGVGDFFPADAYGTRRRHEKGTPVNIKADGHVRSTDIRVKSSLTISPRARYVGLLRRLRCKPGDKVRLWRRGEREYELEFLSEPAGGLVDTRIES